MLIVGYLAVDSDYALSAGHVSMYDLYRVLHLISLYTCMILTLVLFYRLLTADPGIVLDMRERFFLAVYTKSTLF